MATGIVRDIRFLDHFMGPGHVECPERLEAIYETIDAAADLPCRLIKPRAAAEAEIESVHAREYLGFLKGTAGRPHTFLDPDTSTSSLSYATALLAAGGVLEAADRIMEGEVGNAFAAIRPPGHHAERNHAKGFCLFNNIAIAAEHLLRRHGLKRVLIADWDVHHGNGTQHAFYERNDVLFFSTHQFPFYPGTGYWDEVGTGAGEGFTVNVPLGAGKGDRDYLFIYRNILGPIAAAFEPEFVLVSAGFDIYEADPLGGMQVGLEGFAALASELKDQAGILCGGRLLIVLEGGYNLEGQALGVREILRTLAGVRKAPSLAADVSLAAEKEIAPVYDVQRKYWPL